MKRAFLIITASVIIAISILLAVNPGYADKISTEDNLLENITVAVAACGLVLSLILFYKGYRGGSGYGIWLFLSVFLVIFIGDEISWGINYLGIAKPKIAGIDFDGLHDLFGIGIGAIQMARDYVISKGPFSVRALPIYAMATAIVGGALLLIQGIIDNREKIASFFSKNIKFKPFFFIFIGIAILVLAIFIDDDNLVSFSHKAVVEETLEFLAAVSFLFSCLSGTKRDKPCMK